MYGQHSAGWLMMYDFLHNEGLADTGDFDDVVCPKCHTPVEED